MGIVTKKRRRATRGLNLSKPSKTDSPTRLAGPFVLIREVLILSCLAIFVFLAYSNTISSPFVFDDVPNIQKNTNIRLTKITLKVLPQIVRWPISALH